MPKVLSSQDEADAFLAELRSTAGGHLNKTSYQWPAIDYTEVSTATCQAVFALIKEKQNRQSYTEVTPETPRHQKITRQLDAVLTEREYLAKRRVFAAQTLDENINKEMATVFTSSVLLGVMQKNIFLNALRHALNNVEDMVRGSSDVDGTASDSEAEDPDTPR
ncbi:hypothetical protein B0H13DRAFT_1927567 [Mycena leptocephala]|nr:hypothetical protein B0H13DRAFT_1927567 [Mycena leptocephala]